jgi:hypothetical protein
MSHFISLFFRALTKKQTSKNERTSRKADRSEKRKSAEAGAPASAEKRDYLISFSIGRSNAS